MKWEFEDYSITIDKSLVSVDRVKDFLSDTYWGKSHRIGGTYV